MEDQQINERFKFLSWALNERLRRLLAASEAKVIGRGGVTQVSRATGISRRAIYAGLKELEERNYHQDLLLPARRTGGGRKKITQTDSSLVTDLESLLEPTQEDSPLSWTTKGLRVLSAELSERGHKLSHTSVGILLKEMGYSIQTNERYMEPANGHVRNGQFSVINDKTHQRVDDGNPVIYLETAWTETTNAPQQSCRGNSKNTNLSPSTAQEHYSPGQTKFPNNKRSRIEPANFHFLQTFAIHTCRDWWQHSGARTYPEAQDLLIISDGGGSNGPRTRFWKLEVQKLANYIGLPVLFCHFPSGTTRWNYSSYQVNARLDHASRNFVSDNYRVTLKVIGLQTMAKHELNANEPDQDSHFIWNDVPYEKFSQINLVRDEHKRDWNYAILPNDV